MVSIEMHERRVRELVTSRDGPVFRKMADLTRRVENGAKQRCPVDDGALRASISSTVESRGMRVTGTVGTPLEYGRYVHEGTGIYGPSGSPITPKHGNWLVFERSRSMGPPKRGGKQGAKGKRGGLIFAKSVKGQPPNPFLADALRAVVPWNIEVFD